MTSDGAGDPSAGHRLQYSVVPRRYRLHLAPDLDSESFTGTVDIDAEAREPLERITLHALELTVTSATVTSGEDRLTARWSPDPAHEDRLVLDLPRPVQPGPLHIELSFSGKLLEQLCGFYQSKFTDDDGRQRTLAVTQFEATDARRAFPCFDEPDRKAVFSVSVDVSDGWAAFSNSPVAAEESLTRGGRRLVFEDTIPMSTYLVALVVGPLEATEPVDVDGTEVRVVHVPGRKHLTAFALEVATHALRFFTEWFGLPYPGAKLDLLAVPDFAFGAMENLGCVVFRETTLLVDPERASRQDLERVADVVSHEIAHMWFGDLVTMKWWNGIWLNEAFASLMELLAVDDFRPEWERWVNFGVERDSAMATDSLHSTRPVEYPVGPPEDAQGMFDVLTYQKGAGVLRMLERYLGADVFRSGIRRYLAAHQLGNTETADLWSALEEASGQPVRRIMDSWILQGGFPLVSVERSGGGDGADGTDGAVVLDHEPFRYRPEAAESAIGERWSVPVLLREVQSSDVERMLLDDGAVTVEAGESPVVVNAGGWGFYRVGYDRQSLEQLSGVAGQLETLERYNLLSDTWASVVAGRAELTAFMGLAEALRDDPEPGVWRPVTGALDFLDHIVEDGDRDLLAAYGRAVVGPQFGVLGWDRRPGEGERTATLRSELLRTLGTVGADPEVRRSCLERHAAAVSGGAALDPDLAPAVQAVVARAGGPEEFDTFLERYRHPPTPQEGIRYLQGLAGFEDLGLAERAFDIATTEARTQDGPFVVYALLVNRVAGAQSWTKLEAAWDDLQARFPANIFTRMLEGIRLMCRQPELADRIERFLAAHPVAAGQRTVDQAIERLSVNRSLAGRLSGSLADDLKAGIDRLSGS